MRRGRTKPDKQSSRAIENQARILFKHHAAESGFIVIGEEATFHPVRKWAFDFHIAPDDDLPYGRQVAVELEGGIWTSGRHSRGTGFQEDLDKYNAAAAGGWTVFRFSIEDVNKGKDLITLLDWKAFRRR